MKTTLSLTAAAVLGLSLAACGEQDEPIEEEVEAAGNEVRDGAEDFGDDVEDAAEDAGDDVEDAVDPD